MLLSQEQNSVSYSQYVAQMDVCMGGRAAEELIFGKENITSGAMNDLRVSNYSSCHLVLAVYDFYIFHSTNY